MDRGGRRGQSRWGVRERAWGRQAGGTLARAGEDSDVGRVDRPGRGGRTQERERERIASRASGLERESVHLPAVSTRLADRESERRGGARQQKRVSFLSLLLYLCWTRRARAGVRERGEGFPSLLLLLGKSARPGERRTDDQRVVSFVRSSFPLPSPPPPLPLVVLSSAPHTPSAVPGSRGKKGERSQRPLTPSTQSSSPQAAPPPWPYQSSPPPGPPHRSPAPARPPSPTRPAATRTRTPTPSRRGRARRR